MLRNSVQKFIPEPIKIVFGPTSSGKSKLALELASIYNASIISADSRQIYKYLDIGTGQLTIDKSHYSQSINFNNNSNINPDINNKEMIRFSGTEDEVIFQPNEIINNINIYLTKFLTPNIIYSVSDFQRHCFKLINYIHSLNKNVIICGGTGLYLDSLWINHEYGNEVTLFDIADLEFITTNITKEQVYQNINTRVEQMFDLGWIEEVKWLLDNGYSESRITNGAGYSEIKGYLSGIKFLQTDLHLSADSFPEGSNLRGKLITKCQTVYRNYAKRQYTWFRKEPYNLK